MISKKYKIFYDIANCVMIYILSIAFSIGASTVIQYAGGLGGFSIAFAIGAAIILAGFLIIRLNVSKKVLSIAIHIGALAILGAIVWFLPVAIFDKVLLMAYAVILTIIDINDFDKKRTAAYGEIHVISCLCFLLIYAFVAYMGEKYSYAPAGVFTIAICLMCILFFALTLIRSYLANAMKLADNSHMDEDDPVSYMYNNSNKFIGPIIVLIVAIMLVVQSRASANIFAVAWISLLSGVAAICNSILFLNSDASQIDNVTQIAAKGTTQYITEVVIASLIVVVIVVLIGLLISKIYKSHWRKDESADETLESAAMVEKREWIYHKESKRKSEDTSVTKAAEIPTEIQKDIVVEEEKTVAKTEEPAPKKVEEAVEEKAEEAVEAKAEEAVEAKAEEVVEAKAEEAAEEKAEEKADTVEEKTES